MGPKGLPLAGLFLLLTFKLTWAQLSHRRGFYSQYGTSEAPCGPGVQNSMPAFQQPNGYFNGYPSGPSGYHQQGINPLHAAAMMDVDVPPYGLMPAFGGYPAQQPQPYNQWPASPPQQQSSYGHDYRSMGRQPMSYRQPGMGQSYSSHSSRRRVKRRAMFAMQGMAAMARGCQCDSAADCNMMATMRGSPYNHQCASRLRLVCCCRVG